MTLVLTSVTPYGIATAADDALTETLESSTRVLRGATKLFLHHGCRAGFGTWGAGALPHLDEGKAPVAMEFILKAFLRQAVEVRSANDLVNSFVDWLNGRYRRAKEAAVVDVGICLPIDEQFQPAIYRIANCDDPEEYPPRIRAFSFLEIRGPAPFDERRDKDPVPGGVINAGRWVSSMMDGMTQAASATDTRSIPGETLEQRTTFLGIVARAVSDTFLRADLSRSIGPNILTLSIPIDGGPPALREMA